MAASTCGAGRYIKTPSTSTADTECQDCLKGKASMGGEATSCTECNSDGRYSDEDNASVCKTAPAGSKPTSNRQGTEGCLAGTYSVGGADDCNNCESGKYSSAGAAGCTSASTCGAGKFVKTPSTSTTDTECEDCAVGKASAGGQSSCEECEVGNVAPTQGKASCDYCGAGKYASSTTNSCESCQPSTYSFGGTASCLTCNANTYSDTVGATVCKFCSAGQVPSSDRKSCVNCIAGEFSSIGDTTCSQCLAGLYSSSGSGVCSYCDPGTYSTAASSTCTPCPGGQVSSIGAASCGDCVAGKYDDGNNVCQPCPAGSFSSAGSTACDSSCPAGTYGKMGETTCSNCEAGKFATLGAASCELCLAGTYSGPRAGECSICAAGYFSSAGATECNACEGGFYSHGQSSGCSMCTSGKYSKDEAGVCSVCVAGKYSGTGASSCAICAAGKYSHLVSETDGASSCTDCDSGKFSSEGSESCAGSCLPGTYGGPGSSVCVDCGAGTYSEEPGADSCINCPGGKYSGPKAGLCVNCVAGKSSGNAAALCETCVAGQGYVSSEGQSQCEYCGAGQYADSESNTCVNCDKGKFSTGGSNTCEDCEAGRRSVAGASSCNPCEPGEIAIDQVCTKCAKGEYAGFGAETCSSCDGEGEYSDKEGAGSCLSAPAGRKPSVNRQSTVLCPPGRYSLGGETNCTVCSEGKYSSSEGAAGCSTCSTCVPGKYKILDCSADTETQCGDCLKGKASMGGEATSCTECNTAGQYSDEDGASVCKTAPAGTKPTSDRQGVEDCAAGTYSVGGANECSDCGSGETSAAGAAGCSTCAVCQPGKYKISSCTVDTPTQCGNCLKGKASMGGDATSCTECNTAGQYSDENNASFCKTASAGTKPTSDRQGVESCSAGTYSIGGNDECSECGSGETSDTGAAGCRTCATCGLGKYQITECTSTTETQCGDCIAGKASMGGAVSECTLCDGPGEYSEAKASVCKIAPAGYKPKVTGDDGLKTETEICPKNTFSIGATDDCTDCADGGHSSPGESSCKKCSTGKYYDEPSNDCKLCPKNTFSISGATNINGCEDCTNGGHSQPGSGFCENCLTGTYFDEDNNECYACPQGKFSDTGANKIENCQPCDDGFISDNPFGAGFCSPCAAGFFANPAQTTCLPCSPGTISGIAAKKCDACEKGKFAIGFNNTGCKFCDDKDVLKGSTTTDTNSTSASSCVCEQGEFESDSTGICEAVSEGVKSSVGGMNVKSLDLEVGFWRTSSSSTEILPCLNPKHCKGGADTADLCTDGYTGPLCAVCASGYAATGSGRSLECNVCTGDAQTTIIVYSSVLVAIVLIVVVGYCCCCRPNRTVRPPTQSRPSVSHSSSSFADGITRMRTTTIDARSKYKVLVRAKGPILKVLISYYQVMTMLPFVLDLSFPPVFMKVSNLFGSIVNLNFISLMPLGCIMPSNFLHQMVGYTAIPFVIGLFMIIAYNILKRNESTISLSNEIFASFLFMTFLILPSVSIQIFSTFACREFDGDYGTYLKVDYSIDCDGGWDFYWYYACVMVFVYPIGIPLLYHLQLKHAQSKMYLDPGQLDFIGKKTWKRQGVKEEMWEFVLIDTSSAEDEGEEINEANSEEIKIKFELAKAKARAWTERGLMVAMRDPKPPKEEGNEWEKVESLTEEESLQCAVYFRSRNEEEHPSMMRISFLYSMYEPKCYDFEVKETVRKLLLTGGLIFFKPGSASQIVVSILMCLGSIRTYASYNPFVDPKTDIIAEVSQWSLFFIMFGALLIRVNMDSESLQDQGYFDAILVGVNLTPLLLPVIQQLAIMKTFKKVEVLSTLVSAVGSYFGFGGDLVAAKKQMETLKKNLQDLTKKEPERERGGRDVEEAGLELVGFEPRAVTLGGGSMPRTSKFDVANPLRDMPTATAGPAKTSFKNKADTGRPNSSFDAFRNPNLALGGKGGS